MLPVLKMGDTELLERDLAVVLPVVTQKCAGRGALTQHPDDLEAFVDARWGLGVVDPHGRGEDSGGGAPSHWMRRLPSTF